MYRERERDETYMYIYIYIYIYMQIYTDMHKHIMHVRIIIH